MHDARVFRNSPLYHRLTNVENGLLPATSHLIGDAAYPLMINLMTPFRNNGHLTPAQITYNTKLASIRSTIERTFGLLKGKFRRLKYLDVSDNNLGIDIIGACCVLHNFILDADGMEIDEIEENILIEDEYDNLEGRQNAAEMKRNRIVDLFV